MAARATLIFLYCVEWGYAIKTSLIVIISAMLLAAVGLLVLEIIGVKSSNVAPPQNVAKPEEPPLLLMPSAPLEQESELAATEDADDEQQPESELELAAEAVLVDDAGGAEAGTVIVGESELKVGYNRSFTAKLVQSEDPLKGFYSVIKNELLRYGLKQRMSTGNESWYRGRTTYAKFAIRGKTLSLYMALDPDEFEGTKYNFRDTGNVNKYGKVPMRMKIKSDRSVRWVKELIATMAEKKGWSREELEEKDFRYVKKRKKR